MMIMLARLVVGLLVLKVAAASPTRHARQVELDTYDSNNYDVGMNLENQDVYDYYDGVTIDEPQIEIGTLAPPEESAVGEEEGEEAEETEIPIKPQLIPAGGSGGSGQLMGPDSQGEEELRLTPIDILQISGDLGESGEASGASGDAGGSGASGDFGSGVFSGASGDFGSGGSGGSGASSGEEPSEASGEIEYSGISGEFSGEASGTSGDFGTEASGTSGDLGSAGSGVSGDLGSGASGSGSGSGIVLVPDGEEELPLVPDLPEEASGASAEESGEPESGEEEVIVVPTIVEEDELLPTVPTTPEEVTGGVVGSGESGSPDIDIDIDSTEGMSTCMLCTCLGGSVYCDDVKLQSVPPLPKDTTHFYARYNKITKINKSDFANMNKLKRIDLTSNEIGRVDDDAFFGLPALQELVVRENRLVHLPALPASMTLIDASINKLGSTGIQKEAFKDMAGLLYLYLTDNNIDYVPVPLPDSLRSLHLQNNNIQMLHEDTFCNVKDLHYIRYALEDVRLDGNPLNLSRTPHAYVCLPRIPIGALI
ncbi:epiphycan [Alosa sapidissima]|uniref:epiphycan n=1 Tax=Alosa sapidissima TaxID=34773 RepID=UPI001C0996BA|nr:epiphycan [Alosa sapidissima]